MKSYTTKQIADRNGIHPNTVRLYEKIGFISLPDRDRNGYRLFTELHMEQTKLVRMALSVEVLQNGLRKMAIDIVKASAAQQFDLAIQRVERYIQHIKEEQRRAEEAIVLTEQLLVKEQQVAEPLLFTRKEVSLHLQVSMDMLRNWEMNGLLQVKRMHNGYRVYTEADIRLLKIIRSLRCANYSLAAILRMLQAHSSNPHVNLREAIDTPQDEDEIISACDKLLTSLRQAKANGTCMLVQLKAMKARFQ